MLNRTIALVIFSIHSLAFAQESGPAPRPVLGKVVNRATGETISSVCATYTRVEDCKAFQLVHFDGVNTRELANGEVFTTVPNIKKEFRTKKRNNNEGINYAPNPVEFSKQLWGKDSEHGGATKLVDAWKAPGIIRGPAYIGASAFDFASEVVGRPVGWVFVSLVLWPPMETSLWVDSLRAQKAVRVLLEDGGDIRLGRLNFKYLLEFFEGECDSVKIFGVKCDTP